MDKEKSRSRRKKKNRRRRDDSDNDDEDRREEKKPMKRFRVLSSDEDDWGWIELYYRHTSSSGHLLT